MLPLLYSQISFEMVVSISFVPFMGTVTACALVAAKITESPLRTFLVWSFGAALPLYLFYQCYIYPFYLSPLRHIPTVPGFPLWGQFFTIITEEVGVPLPPRRRSENAP